MDLLVMALGGLLVWPVLWVLYVVIGEPIDDWWQRRQRRKDGWDA